MTSLREWWQARARRERSILAAGAVALAAAILWAYVWTPIAAERDRLVESLPRMRLAARDVARAAAEIPPLRAAARARGDAASPQSAVTDALKAAGLGDGQTRVATLGENRIQVTLRPVPFDALLRVLAQLAESHGLAVESMAVKATGEPGKVQVETLVLRGARGA